MKFKVGLQYTQIRYQDDLKNLKNSELLIRQLFKDAGKRIRYKITSKGNVILPFLVEAMKALKKAEDLL